MPRRLPLSILILLSVATGPLVAAHITDKLVVGLYPGPTAEGQPLQLLSSGTPLEVLERRSGFVEVRLADDATGWVEADYVTDEKPAKALLLETQARLRQMGLELARLRGESASDAGVPVAPAISGGEDSHALAQARQEIAALERSLAEQRGNSDAQARLERLTAQVREALGALAESQGLELRVIKPGAPVHFVERYQTVIIGIAALVLGFGGGVAFIDYRIRRRYGGFRI